MTKTYYTWDRLNGAVLMESDENGNTLATYSNDLDGTPLSQRRNGVNRTYHYDGMDNVVALTDDNGDVTDTYEYSAFGEVIAKTGNTVNPFGFKGALGYYASPGSDELYTPQRTYQPASGRWLSPIPITSYAFLQQKNKEIILDPKTIKINDFSFVATTTLYDCGGVEVKWRLSLPENANGILIQHVHLCDAAATCRSCKSYSRFPNACKNVTTNAPPISGGAAVSGALGVTTTCMEFAEAWSIVNGKIEGTNDNLYDVWGYTGRYNTFGDFEAWTRLSYYQGATLPRNFRVRLGDGCFFSRGLKATSDAPSTWRPRLPAPTAEFSGKLKTRWDCCKAPTRVKVLEGPVFEGLD